MEISRRPPAKQQPLIGSPTTALHCTSAISPQEHSSLIRQLAHAEPSSSHTTPSTSTQRRRTASQAQRLWTGSAAHPIPTAMSFAYPPPMHSYQRGMRGVHAQASKHMWNDAAASAVVDAASPSAAGGVIDDASAAASPSASVSASESSPLAVWHRSLLEQRSAEAHKAAMMVAAASGSAEGEEAPSSSLSTPRSPTAFLSVSHQQFPPLPRVAPYASHCAIHSPLLAPLVAATGGVQHRCCLKRASFWNTRCSCLFSALPDELLLFSVFPYLSPAELCGAAAVCSRWRFVSADRMLWRRLDLSPYARAVDNAVFDNMLSRVGPHVSALKLCNLKQIDSAALLRMGQQHLADNHANLRQLHLCSLRAVDTSVIESLVQNGAAANLRELSLFGCINIDDAAVRMIRAACPRLEELSLRGCLNITDAAFIDAEEEQAFESPQSPSALVVEEIADPLELLQLSNSSRSSSMSSDSSAGSTPLEAASPVAAGSFANLTSLNVANCKLLTAAGLTAAFRHSPRLQRLNLHALNPSDALLEELTSSCPDLEQLHLSSSNPFGGNRLLTDAGVLLLASRLPRLSQLNLQGSSNITDACLPSLVQGCPLMEKLNLGGCHRLTDAAVRVLTQADVPVHQSYPSRLTHLSLFQCSAITDASVELVAAHLPLLQHLDVHSCAALTDAALDVLTQVQPADNGDDDVDDGSLLPPSPRATRDVAALVLPHLASLDVGSCRKLTKERVQALKLARPTLHITHY